MKTKNEKNEVWSCDVLIIGSGPGGATVADSFAERGLDALIIEEGKDFSNTPLPESASLAMTELWKSAGLLPSFGNANLVYAEGQCVGGGSEINSSILQRPDDRILQYWARRIPDLNLTELKNGFSWAENKLNASIPPGDQAAPSLVLKNGAEKLGWDFVFLKRGQVSCMGTNHCSTGCPTGAKQSMSKTLISKYKSRSGRLEPNISVIKLVKEGDQVKYAIAEKFSDGIRQKIKIVADFFFVCCGTIGTSVLLQKSGLKTWKSASFQTHPTIKFICEFDHEISALENQLPVTAIHEFMPKYRLGGSVLSCGSLGMALAENWKARKYLATMPKRVGMFYAMINPESWGRVLKLPVLRDPLVLFNLSDKDASVLIEAMNRLAKVLFAGGAVKVFPSIRNHGGWGSFAEAEADLAHGIKIGDMNLYSIHLFSSCSAISDYSENDVFGRVKACRNTFIADSSLIPSAPAVNPQLSVMAFSKMAADSFLQRI